MPVQLGRIDWVREELVGPVRIGQPSLYGDELLHRESGAIDTPKTGAGLRELRTGRAVAFERRDIDTNLVRDGLHARDGGDASDGRRVVAGRAALARVVDGRRGVGIGRVDRTDPGLERRLRSAG